MEGRIDLALSLPEAAAAVRTEGKGAGGDAKPAEENSP